MIGDCRFRARLRTGFRLGRRGFSESGSASVSGSPDSRVFTPLACKRGPGAAYSSMPQLLALALTMLVIVVVLALPVKMAAAMLGASRTGLGSCFLALVCASIAQAIGFLFFPFGSAVAFLLAACMF